MLRSGFRLKLVVAMMTVVVLGTGASLYVAQQRVQAAYRQLSEEEFRSQFERFTELQEARLAGVKDRCLELVTHSVRLRAAMEENDAELTYAVAADEMRSLEGPGARRSRPSFFQFFDASGRLIRQSDSSDQTAATRIQLRREGGYRLVRQVLETGTAQELGVAPLSLTNEPRQLYELVVTRIPRPEDDQALGVLLLAFPAVLPGGPSGRSFGRRPPDSTAGPNASSVRMGIWSGGELFARDEVFAPGVRAELIAALEKRLASGAETQGEMRLLLQGEPNRVLFESMMPNAASAERDIPYQFGVYSLAESERQQAALRRQILGFGAGTLIAALFLSGFLAHGLSVPIRELVGATAEVRRGNFRAKVPVRSGDELGQLAGAFNEMTEGLELKERYRTVLNSVADERVAKQLLEGGLALGGEERRVSVVFCDIRGFTAHTENMTAREIVDMLNEHMTALTRVVKANYGVLDKYVGDLLMALFGAPMNRSEDPVDAARCALGLVEERAKLDQTSRHQLAIGVGVATGQVVAGCMGSVERLDYTVIGERVNLASRLCSMAKPGQVVIDDQTRAALGARAEVRPLAPVRLKGFSEPVQAYELLALHDAPETAAEREVPA